MDLDNLVNPMDVNTPVVPTTDINTPVVPTTNGGDIQSIIVNNNAGIVAPAAPVAPVMPESLDLDAIYQANYEAEMTKYHQQLWEQQQMLLAQQQLAAAMQAQMIQSIITLPTQADILAAQQAAAAQLVAQQPVVQDLNSLIAQTPIVPDYVGGNTIFVPSNVKQTGIIKNYTNYNYFYGKWSKGSAQRNLSEMWNASGRTNDRGIATLNNRYLVAVSPTFGKVGDNIDVCLDNGVVIPCTIADAKGSDAKSMWGHTFGKAVDIIEWESMGGQSVINTDGWQGHSVDRIVNYSA